ncbi:MAG: hypothetical protein QXV61_00125 [Archaeoglobaceae archaeon]
MATQEEVLNVIVEFGGVISFSDLKTHFKLPKSGSSWLPQRIRGLEKKNFVFRMRVGETYFIANPDLIDFDLRGRPRGRISINATMELKLLKFIEKNKVVVFSQIRQQLKWDAKTTRRYLEQLLKKNMIIEIVVGRRKAFTTIKAIDDIMNSYYNKLYQFSIPERALT